MPLISKILMLGVVALLAVVVFIERRVDFDQAKNVSRYPGIAMGVLTRGKLGQVLKERDLIADPVDGYRAERAVTFTNFVLQNKNTRVFNSAAKASLVSLNASPAPNQARIPELFIEISERELYDVDNGILEHIDESGRRWERNVDVIVKYADRESRLQSGLRVTSPADVPYGLFSEEGDLHDQAFKLYFRKRHGHEGVADGVFFDEPQNHQLLGLELLKNGPVQNAIGLDIARQAGLLVPAAGLVKLQLNEQRLGLRLAMEPVRRKQWFNRLGHAKVKFLRSDDDDAVADWKEHSNLRRAIRKGPSPTSMSYMDGHISVEQLTRTLAVYLFCGARSWQNWALLRDRVAEDGRWQFVTWGLEECDFFDPIENYPHTDRGQFNKSQHSVVGLTKSDIGITNSYAWLDLALYFEPRLQQWRTTYPDVRLKFIARLLNEDPDYLPYMLNTFRHILEEDLNLDFLSGRAKHYRTIYAEMTNPTAGGQTHSVHRTPSHAQKTAEKLLFERMQRRREALLQQIYATQATLPPAAELAHSRAGT